MNHNELSFWEVFCLVMFLCCIFTWVFFKNFLFDMMLILDGLPEMRKDLCLRWFSCCNPNYSLHFQVAIIINVI